MLIKGDKDPTYKGVHLRNQKRPVCSAAQQPQLPDFDQLNLIEDTVRGLS
jgi:hypothetical protein